MLQLPAFGETGFTDHRTNATARVVSFTDATEAQFEAYRKLFCEAGFVEKETREGYAAYQKEQTGVFLCFYPTTKELRIVTEEDCRYFDFEDRAGESIVVPQISQVHQVDFGLSYAIRLSDGRFVVIDGGNLFPEDADCLYAHLEKGSPFEKPVIAAWFLSHPHSDHFHCVFPFFERYAGAVTVEKFLLNFPEGDDLIHYPKLEHFNTRMDAPTAGTVRIPMLWELIRKAGIPAYMPHTGQVYRIGDATFEVLACMDDTIHISQNINASSLVLRMELAGQVTLWTTDAAFSAARLPERYGSYLKAHILQVPHHGFGCGDKDKEIEGYELIRPEVCLLPAADSTAYFSFSAFVKSTQHLMTSLSSVREMITGSTSRTISLPYTPPADAGSKYRRVFAEGQAAAGSRAWYFTGLSTANPDDSIFTFINSVHPKANIRVRVYFEDQNIGSISTTISGMRRFSIFDPEQISLARSIWRPEAEPALDIPENATYAVRFLSDQPVVIAHDRQAAAYHA